MKVFTNNGAFASSRGAVCIDQMDLHHPMDLDLQNEFDQCKLHKTVDFFYASDLFVFHANARSPALLSELIRAWAFFEWACIELQVITSGSPQ